MTREVPPGAVDGDGRSCYSWSLVASPSGSTAGNGFLFIESLLLFDRQRIGEEEQKGQAR